MLRRVTRLVSSTDYARANDAANWLVAEGPAGIQVLIDTLEHGPVASRTAAASGLGSAARATPKVEKALLALLAAYDRDPNDVRWALIHIDDPRALPAVVDSFRQPHEQQVIDALAALSKQPLAQQREAAPALERLAKEHYHASIRSMAAKAYERVTHVAIPPVPQRCPKGVRHFPGEKLEKWFVEFSSGKVRFEPAAVDADAQDALARSLKIETLHKREVIVQPHGDSIFVGVDRGEFGGWVEVRDARIGAREVLGECNPQRFVERPDKTLVLHGLCHQLCMGGVSEIVPMGDGHFDFRERMSLRAAPLAFTFDTEGRLLLLVTDESPPTCPGKWATDDSYLLLRVDADGTATALD